MACTLADDRRPDPSGRHAPHQDAEPRREIDSGDLLAGGNLVAIRHAGEVYTLRLTRAGKLILTK